MRNIFFISVLFVNTLVIGQIKQRLPGESFSFGVQGDSHPERAGKMFCAELYRTNMQNVADEKLDFYFALGDDFSLDRLIEQGYVSQKSVDEVYLYQKQFFDMAGCQVYLVNGNHEQAAKYLLNGTPDNPAVYAAKARLKFFPLPDPTGIYSGNTEAVDYIGLLKDYFAFEWGDALFITLDPYWHSDSPVDNVPVDRKMKQKGVTESKTAEQLIRPKGDRLKKDPWTATLGDAQYQWLKKTLETSKAKYKFVFAHHVNGFGRGGVECASLYEWGGYDKNGAWQFNRKRPEWEMPIHQLMVKNGVTIFFQGHDHLFCKQELDGVIYQSVPNPADDTYTMFNADAYLSGDKQPNSGHLRINVSTNGVKVDYVRAFLPEDGKNGEVTYSYTVK